jgi:hypothetical protein
VARLVTKEGKEPQLVLLQPEPGVESGYQCLYECTLPFAEDVRAYSFPPLDKVVTVTGNVLTKHRLLPTQQLDKAMSDFVDAMDISEFGEQDAEGYVERLAASPVSFLLTDDGLEIQQNTPRLTRYTILSSTESTKPSVKGPSIRTNLSRKFLRISFAFPDLRRRWSIKPSPRSRPWSTLPRSRRFHPRHAANTSGSRSSPSLASTSALCLDSSARHRRRGRSAPKTRYRSSSRP